MKPMLEVRVLRDCPPKVWLSASNGVFAGASEGYVNEQELEDLCEQLSGFPQNAKDSAKLEVGSKGSGHGHIHLEFLCTDFVGHAAVKVDLAAPETRYAHSSASFSVYFEPSACDEFVSSLRRVLSEGKGSATLNGVSEYTWNIPDQLRR